ncbi:transposase [Gluconobacter oxydans]|uniref:transposase n=1 Tax=Gluconobacter oxydans TaxID=442 RepID=UPI00296FECB8|nr:transposase [Gluconobacter oxydans]
MAAYARQHRGACPFTSHWGKRGAHSEAFGRSRDSFRQDLLLHGILPIIPSRKGRSVPQKTNWWRYRDRNRIERMFNSLKQMRRIATRYDKTALSFMSFLNIAAARLWIRSFVNVT